MFNLSICEKWLRYGHRGLGHKNCFFYTSRNEKGTGLFQRVILEMMDCSLEEKIPKKFSPPLCLFSSEEIYNVI